MSPEQMDAQVTIVIGQALVPFLAKVEGAELKAALLKAVLRAGVALAVRFGLDEQDLVSGVKTLYSEARPQN